MTSTAESEKADMDRLQAAAADGVRWSPAARSLVRNPIRTLMETVMADPEIIGLVGGKPVGQVRTHAHARAILFPRRGRTWGRPSACAASARDSSATPF